MYAWTSTMPFRHAHAAAPMALAEPPPPKAPAPPAESVAQLAPAAPQPAPEVPAPAPSEPVHTPFQNAAAVRALDGKWRDVAKCRRGKAWGKASTTVTFSNDGSVSHVDVGQPFGGTPTGDCIADALAATHVEPFGDRPAVLVYKVYVAPK